MGKKRPHATADAPGVPPVEDDDARDARPGDRPEPDEPATGDEAGQADRAGIAGDAQDRAAGEQLVEAESELAELNDRYLRLLAEFDNFRRRTLREKEMLRLEATIGLIGGLLPVLRDLERARDSANELDNARPVRDGLDLVLKSFRDALDREGVEEIDPGGQAFDEHAMEAVAMLPSSRVPAGHVCEVLQKGYRVGDRLIQPARVIVSAGGSATGESVDDDAVGEEGVE